jgi:hypothetical protein
MKLAIYDAEVATENMGHELVELKEFRRSTRSILKGAALIKKIFERNPSLGTLGQSQRLAFVVGTSVGEIEVTRDFFKDLAVTNTARPFLFQLSSHNSTAGFLAQHFKLQGSTVTVSNEYQSAEAALENAHLLLKTGHCDAALVYCVDQVIDGWMDLKMYARHPQLQAASGASIMLVGLEENLGELKAKAILSDLSYGKASDSDPDEGKFYDSNCLEKIVRLLEQKDSGNHSSVRPDQTETQFSVEVL